MATQHYPHYRTRSRSVFYSDFTSVREQQQLNGALVVLCEATSKPVSRLSSRRLYEPHFKYLSMVDGSHAQSQGEQGRVVQYSAGRDGYPSRGQRQDAWSTTSASGYQPTVPAPGYEPGRSAQPTPSVVEQPPVLPSYDEAGQSFSNVTGTFDLDLEFWTAHFIQQRAHPSNGVAGPQPVKGKRKDEGTILSNLMDSTIALAESTKHTDSLGLVVTTSSPLFEELRAVCWRDLKGVLGLAHSYCDSDDEMPMEPGQNTLAFYDSD